ncbi:DUF1150 family protein [Ferrovibrio sp.]|uniref:DUF1150 family protein n=1 Tax=Ferrovibrio sp. TaxID=1917215 RepID=UPI0025BA2132|nr:DUF1150 family protein [Ferrovibrio sp.]MBX3454569.1 DUF1150 family protein [Ferrovibrio sp.]
MPDHVFKNSAIQLSPEDFANLGAPVLAYVRPIETPEGAAFGIFSASGQPLGVAPERELAFAAALQHELQPVSIQ